MRTLALLYLSWVFHIGILPAVVLLLMLWLNAPINNGK